MVCMTRSALETTQSTWWHISEEVQLGIWTTKSSFSPKASMKRQKEWWNANRSEKQRIRKASSQCRRRDRRTWVHWVATVRKHLRHASSRWKHRIQRDSSKAPSHGTATTWKRLRNGNWSEKQRIRETSLQWGRRVRRTWVHWVSTDRRRLRHASSRWKHNEGTAQEPHHMELHHSKASTRRLCNGKTNHYTSIRK